MIISVRDLIDAPLTVQEGTDDQGLQFVEVCSLSNPDKED